MKKLILILIQVLIIGQVIGQVANDDCLNATDISFTGLHLTNTFCFDGSTIHDTVISSDNINAIPSCPYYIMTGCLGYTSSTVLSNDVWFKLRVGTFYIQVAPIIPAIDTLHLSVWRGQDCTLLSASGCYTYDFSDLNATMPNTFAGAYNGEFVYLQFSGNRINKFGAFQFCITNSGPTIPPYYGTDSIASCDTTAGIQELRIKNDEFKVYPNPTEKEFSIESTGFKIGSVKIYNVLGELVKIQEQINNNKTTIDVDYLQKGIYFYQVIVNDKIVRSDKLIIIK
jgi:hypothetical protein